MTTNKLKKVELEKSADKGTTITALELDALQKAASRVEELEKKAEATATALADAEVKSLALEKSLDSANAKVEAVALEKAEQAKLSMTSIVKGFTFIAEEDQESSIESLLKSKDAVLLAQLEKAQYVIDSFAKSEHGSDLVSEDISKSEEQDNQFNAIASQIMKNRNNKGAK